eukprot:TRINITY_DN33476_c0_g1_i2.p1 TRINITY_DN33476_c0_g1~~TRINITY_DN33476_c0_g1_i2.p1  ORF type:complete len:325 (-),score=-7.53 TRINITY_DN33476_c0_g1_i2:319-1293(-)
MPSLLLAGFGLLVPQAAWAYIGSLLGVSFMPVFIALAFIMSVCGAYVLLGHIEHVTRLRHDLEHFSVQAAACFCCSNDHKHPFTGLPMVCDRELVYENMQQSMTRSGMEIQGDAMLAVFNQEVRTTLKHYVTGVLPESQLFIRYTDMLFMALPMPCFAVDCLIVDYKQGRIHKEMYFLQSLTAWLVVYPLQLNLLLRAMYKVHGRAVSRKRSRTRKMFLACFAWGPFSCLLVIFFFTFMYAANYIENDMVWLFFVAIMAEALLVFCLFARPSVEQIRLSLTSSTIGKSDSEPACDDTVWMSDASAASGAGSEHGCSSCHSAASI